MNIFVVKNDGEELIIECDDKDYMSYGQIVPRTRRTNDPFDKGYALRIYEDASRKRLKLMIPDVAFVQVVGDEGVKILKRTASFSKKEDQNTIEVNEAWKPYHVVDET